MTNNNFSQVAALIWSVADLLRGDFKQSQYGRMILPFTLLRRLGEFDNALDDAVLDSNTAHTEQMTQLMSDPAKMRQFANIIYAVLVIKKQL
ncbi:MULTISPECIES: type I restriction-modification system subunit M N-terminal domain-containing protein [unclassified Acinetobacter]|uniref:type I restriction-modification system subunit M N-terminal domain-containing protein n=1 Tax=unclassified Acinetobacter TaxID=196816 RepID=UPI002447B5B5|nr:MULTISPECIES: type I restriction-modification system subunit M N-terminal domain-containing protein [unclassified Acinetobacter]MDH0030662.1 type I restriction-modification system subunit M N-terminal domain-containing protein [Acinetobacter sp. GD04021]MDH0886228.1 type I restriction-modification system subunit M N-terminal domain-containing protein [Acinetobacter sp. GD03873]MDH1081798.1 type I restriction-modification system subunit M N-terminal domain-containing protein [Acinetobacter sp.